MSQQPQFPEDDPDPDRELRHRQREERRREEERADDRRKGER